jgi:hypothetical protein
MSRVSIDDRLATAHLDRAVAAAAARSGSHQRAALVAAACLAAVALPAAGIVIARAGHGSDPVRNQPVLPAIELSCPGGAPVIADDLVGDTTAEGAADPQTESDELVQRGAVTCPRPEDVVDSTIPAATECFGPLSDAATPAESADPKAMVVPSTKADRAPTQAESHRECRTATSTTTTTTTGASPTSTTVGLNAPASAADANSAQAPTATQTGPHATVANPAGNGDGSADNLATPVDAGVGPPPGASNSAADVDHSPDNVPAADAEPGPPSGVPLPPDNVPAAAAAEPGGALAVPGPPEDVSGPPDGVPDQAAGGR